MSVWMYLGAAASILVVFNVFVVALLARVSTEDDVALDDGA